jgi:hypothetical protein
MEADTGLRTYFETCAGIDPKHLQPVFDSFDTEKTGFLDKAHFESLVNACLQAQRAIVPQLVHNVVGINQEVFHHVRIFVISSLTLQKNDVLISK